MFKIIKNNKKDFNNLIQKIIFKLKIFQNNYYYVLFLLKNNDYSKAYQISHKLFTKKRIRNI